MKTFLVRDEAAFKLRVKVSNCLNPADLKFIEFVGEQYNNDGELVNSSTYEFFLENQHIAKLVEGLQHDHV
jgi:hypothetical protein